MTATGDDEAELTQALADVQITHQPEPTGRVLDSACFCGFKGSHYGERIRHVAEVTAAIVSPLVAAARQAGWDAAMDKRIQPDPDPHNRDRPAGIGIVSHVMGLR